MLAGYLTGVLLCLAALAVGQAAMALCGRRRPSVLAPAVGLSLLLIVANLTIQLPGSDATAAIALGGLVLGAAAVLATATNGPLGTVASRRTARAGVEVAGAVHGGRIPATIAALIAAFAASIPFLASGRMGPLGQGLVNDDMASHLLFTEWIATDVGRTPDLVADGYPLAPHSLVGAVAEATGTSFVEVFAGLTLALAALAALTAYGALGNARPWLRVPAGVLVSLPYLGAAWLAQGAFKEPMLAFFLVAFALGLRELEIGRPDAAPAASGPQGEAGARAQARAGVEVAGAVPAALPLGLIAAGALYAYSFPALAWLGAAAIAWALLEGRERARAALPPAAIAIAFGIPLLAAIPEAGRLIDFAGFGAFDPEGEGPRVGLGNLDNALTPLEGFNVWPASDFRVDASAASLPAIVFYLGGLLGAAALTWGVLAAIGRRESALLGALVAGALGYLGAVAFGTPYTSAKALTIAAPIAMLIALRGLLAPSWAGAGLSPRDFNARTGGLQGSDGPERPIRRGGEPGARPSHLHERLAPLRIPLALLFVVGAAVSSFLPLRAAAVGPDDHATEVRSLRPLIDGRRVLFLGRDQFVAWELIGSKVATPILNYYNQKSIGNRYEPTPVSVKLDFDAVTPELLDFYAFVITTRAAFQSAPPPNFKLVGETSSYRLWERTGPTPPRETLDEPRGPGSVLDCSTPEGRELSRGGGTAVVLPAPPVVGPEAGWQPSARVTDARSASQELLLDPGRWSISLQYSATQEATVTAPGLEAALPANLDFRGPSPLWRVGEIEVGGRGPVRFTVSVDEPPPFGRLIGADSLAFPLTIAATRVGPPETVPLARACGRYVDYYTPG